MLFIVLIINPFCSSFNFLPISDFTLSGSLAKLAAECDFEKSNMARIEKGNTNPTYKTLYKIAKALSISITELVNID